MSDRIQDLIDNMPEPGILNDRIFIRQAAIAAMQGWLSFWGRAHQLPYYNKGIIQEEGTDIEIKSLEVALKLLAEIKKHEAEKK